MNLLDIKEPILLDNILPNQENLEILKHVSTIHYQIQTDSHEGVHGKLNSVFLKEIENVVGTKGRFESAFLKEVKHAGFACAIYNEEVVGSDTINPISPLIIWTRIIIFSAMEKLNALPFTKISRLILNYYNKDQEGINHVDHSGDNYVSLIYTPLTTDGGTTILGKFYPDKMGQVKIFKSNWLHTGVCVKEDKARVSLNIVLRY